MESLSDSARSDAGTPVLRYAARRLNQDAVESQRVAVLLAIVLGAPLLLESFIIAGARWAVRREGGRAIDQWATGTTVYLRLLYTFPLTALALVLLGVAAWTLVNVHRRRWHGGFAAIIPALLVVWFVFYVVNLITVWNDYFP